MRSESIRVGFIGAGNVSRRKQLPALARMAGVEVVAVCNRSPESSRAVADEFDIPDVETDAHRLVGRDDLDAIFIGTWPYKHREFSVAALEAGKHCFCQARMCMDLDEAKQMLAAARARPHLVNMLATWWAPLQDYLCEMVRSGRLGEPTSAELRAISGGNLDSSKVHWRERVEYSGKQIMSLGIYAEALNSMLGPYRGLTAHTSTPIPLKTDADGRPVQIGVPQVVAIAGQLESGALAMEHHTGLAAEQPGREASLVVRGLEGTVRYDLDEGLEFAGPGEPLKPVHVPEASRTHRTEEAEFIAAVRAARAGRPPEERPVRPDFAEGLLYMRKVEAVHLSAATGQSVVLANL